MQDTLENRIAQDAKVGVGTGGWLSPLGWLQARQDREHQTRMDRLHAHTAEAAHGIAGCWARIGNHVGARNGIPAVWEAYERGEWGDV